MSSIKKRNAIVPYLGGGALGTLCAVASLMIYDLAQAQGASAIEEIMVTAQRRTERLQDVPISIAAMSGESVEKLGAEGFRTIANRVPGLQLVEVDPTQTQLVMRGVVTSQVASDKGQLQDTVGLYFDEAPVNIAIANPNFGLYDMERVEVLRGPQGTLYGAGSMSGAIRYITKKPDPSKVEAAGSLTGSSTEHGGENFAGHGVINVPLVDEKSAIRAVGYYRNFDGFLDNIGSGTNNSNDDETYGGRLASKWLMGENFSVTAQAVYQKTNLGDRFVYFQELGDLQRSTTFNENRSDEQQLYSLNAEYDFDSAQLASATSYRKSNQLINTEFGAGTILFLGAAPGQFESALPTVNKAKAFTQELRLQSSGEQRFKWIVGGFYSHDDRLTLQTWDVPGIEDFAGLPPGSDFGVPTDRIILFSLDLSTEQIAVFGEASYAVTDQLEITLGARYYDYSQNAVETNQGVFAGGDFADLFKASDNGINPKLNVSYKITDDHMIYVQAARGFRIGGVGARINQTICGDDLAELGLSGGTASFGPDRLWNYEAGAKTSWADGRVTLNAAAYYIDWSNIQTFQRLTCGFNAFFNAGAAEVKGLELELTAQILEQLSFSAGLSYTDAKIKSLTSAEAQAIGAQNGDELPYVPQLTAYAAVEQGFEITDGLEGFMAFDVSYVDDRRTSFESAPTALKLDSYTMGNMRFGIRRENWEAAAFVDNLWDERPDLNKERYRFHEASVSAGGVVTRVSTARPRTFGLTVRFSM